MALFMPTNVLPSLTGGVGAGCVDLNDGLAAQWQVNGSSPMTAFSVTIYSNDAASTQLYTTGKIADGCPFYGVDASGQQQVFSYTISAAALAGAGVANGGAYKLVVQQWWSENDSVVQSSASAFIGRDAPVLALNAVPNPMAAKTHTFGASYSQAQGDTLDFVRWQVASGANGEVILLDTGNIYGTGQLSCTYDGMFDGETYSVRCSIQTSSGVSADTGWTSFAVSYSTSELAGFVTASCSKNSTSVLVEWPSLVYSNGHGEGYTVGDGLLQLPTPESYVTWDERNGETFSLEQPWCVGWRGIALPGGGDLLTVSTSAGDIVVSVDAQRTDLVVTALGTEIGRFAVGLSTFGVAALVSPNAVTIWGTRVITLLPGETLYPSGTLYPNIAAEDYNPTYTSGQDFGAFQSVTLGGAQTADYMFVNEAAPTAQLITDMGDLTFSPVITAVSFLTAPFTNGLNAGNLQGTSETLTGLTVYRRDGAGQNLKRIRDVSISEKGLYDYSVVGQNEGYSYYVFPHGDTSFLTNPMESIAPVSPFWWVHSVLQCQRQPDGVYEVVREFWFGKNLTSGAVSNNNTPGVLHNFSRFPTVQTAPQNYQSGQLESLIGWIEDGKYGDSNSIRDAISELSATGDSLFYKNRRGDFFPIRVSGPILFSTADGTREQAITVTLPFVQIAEGGQYSIVNPLSGYVPSQAAKEGGGRAI